MFISYSKNYKLNLMYQQNASVKMEKKVKRKILRIKMKKKLCHWNQIFWVTLADVNVLYILYKYKLLCYTNKLQSRRLYNW